MCFAGRDKNKVKRPVAMVQNVLLLHMMMKMSKLFTGFALALISAQVIAQPGVLPGVLPGRAPGRTPGWAITCALIKASANPVNSLDILIIICKSSTFCTIATGLLTLFLSRPARHI